MVHLLRQYSERRDEAGTFARTLDRELGALWTFVVEEGVEPTNNRAERALRFAVLRRKIMQGSYNEKGDRWVERILSVSETYRLRGLHTFPVLVEGSPATSTVSILISSGSDQSDPLNAYLPQISS
jgi:transposase